jgi:hypothetical protein
LKTDMQRWRGLAALVADAVLHGASAIERVHLATARRTFYVAQRVPGLSEPAKVVQAVHDLAISHAYKSVRGVTTAVAVSIDTVLLMFGAEPPAKISAGEATRAAPDAV